MVAALYFALAIVGGAGTWYYNLQYTGGDYLGAWVLPLHHFGDIAQAMQS